MLFFMTSGFPGSGKTSLIRWLTEWLKENTYFETTCHKYYVRGDRYREILYNFDWHQKIFELRTENIVREAMKATVQGLTENLTLESSVCFIDDIFHTKSWLKEILDLILSSGKNFPACYHTLVLFCFENLSKAMEQNAMRKSNQLEGRYVPQEAYLRLIKDAEGDSAIDYIHALEKEKIPNLIIYYPDRVSFAELIELIQSRDWKF